MDSALIDLGWTDDHLNRISSAVTEEAQRARVAAQMLPVVGPEDPTLVAVPRFALYQSLNPRLNPPRTAVRRLAVNSDPTLFLTSIAVNVQLRTREAQDPDLNGALVMFRRAGNYIARIEDALVFNGRPGPNRAPPFGAAAPAIPNVYQIRGDGAPDGIFPFVGPVGRRTLINIGAAAGATLGDQVITAIIQAINTLDAAGQLGPYACALSPLLFEAICTPNANLVLPRDRILPFLQGPLLRSSAVFEAPPPPLGPFFAWGTVLALSANPIEIVVASDIHVKYLQITEEPRVSFRVSENVALRIKETAAIALLYL
jgi:hypothetical protein